MGLGLGGYDDVDRRRIVSLNFWVLWFQGRFVDTYILDWTNNNLE